MQSPVRNSLELCACGTGLRSLRCCELDLESLPNTDSIALLDSLTREAQRQLAASDLIAGESLVLQLLDLAPQHEEALQLLFWLRNSAGQSMAAEVLARRIAQLPAPAARLAINNLQCAKLLINKLRWTEAEPYVKTVLRHQPTDATAHHFMAATFTATNQLKAGERHYRRALQCLGREDGVVLGNLAWNLKLQGQLDASATIYERALTLRPDNVHAKRGQALVELARGNRARAAHLLDKLLDIQPADHEALLARARLDLLENAPDRALARLQGVSSTADIMSTVGRAYERQGRLPQALAVFRETKRRQRVLEAVEYESVRYASFSALCKDTFVAKKIPAIAEESDPSPFRLVFLLGFPGSGTSLLEQMLAKIPGVATADTLGSIADSTDLAARLLKKTADGYAELMADLGIGSGPEVLAQLRVEYWSRFEHAGLTRPDTRFVTLRDPANVWHLGFIQRLFPEALLVHCLRHPLDVMATNFAETRMLEGKCNESLLTLAQHYDRSMSLIQHYREQLTLCYAALRYEDLIAAPRDTLARLCALIGVDTADLPDEMQIRANAITNSLVAPRHQLWQEPIHSRGLNRHRAYEAVVPGLFDDARPLLQRWIQALGYAP